VERALERDPGQHTALSLQAYSTFIDEHDYQVSVDQLFELVRRHPNSAETHLFLCFVLGGLGYHTLANRVGKRAVELDAISTASAVIGMQLGSGLVDQARETAAEIGGRRYAYVRPEVLAELALAKGDVAELQDVLHRSSDDWGEEPEHTIYTALVHYLSGDPETAREALEPLRSATKYQPFMTKHKIALIDGNVSAGVDNYRRALEAGEPESIIPFRGGYASLTWRRTFADFYTDPRYRRALSSMGLDEESVARISIPELPF
jgi:hypothetical protein